MGLWDGREEWKRKSECSINSYITEYSTGATIPMLVVIEKSKSTTNSTHFIFDRVGSVGLLSSDEILQILPNRRVSVEYVGLGYLYTKF